jgi:broad specificity polyphosphatase/5'/3'-nucleotidase SurE
MSLINVTLQWSKWRIIIIAPHEQRRSLSRATSAWTTIDLFLDDHHRIAIENMLVFGRRLLQSSRKC